MTAVQLLSQDQRPNQTRFQVHISRAVESIEVDGKLDEVDWKKADVAKDFWEKDPRDDRQALLKSTARLTYDDQFLYVGLTCFDSTNHVIRTLKRDVEYWDSDAIAVILDPVNEASYGFMFGVNPLGVQMEAILGGSSGSGNWNNNWDNKWYVETHQYDDRWTVEMAIPFKTLRYEDGKKSWGINFLRNDKKHNEFHVWAAIPRQFWGIDLGYAGQLIWDEAPKKGNGNYSIIPYGTLSASQDFESPGDPQLKAAAGLDAKVAVTSALNLDLTLNPDFSQVEVDDQVTNLTRFNISLPEKRTFFQENSDIYARFGIPPARPFFSRRIGLDEDGGAVPVLFGARLSGNMTKNLRVGLMNMQTKTTRDQAGQNYTAAAINQRIFKRSTIRAMFINRQAFEEGEFLASDYGRNASFEFRYQSPDGQWEGWSAYNHSFKEGFVDNNGFWNAGGTYRGARLSATVDWVNMGVNYFADIGFINRIENRDDLRDTTIRVGYRLLYWPVSYEWFLKDHPSIRAHIFRVENSSFLTRDYDLTDQESEFTYRMVFHSSTSLRARVNWNRINLRFPFSFTDDEPLPVDWYTFATAGFRFSSDERKLFTYEIGGRYGGFYNGKRATVVGRVSYRTQPWGNFSINLEYNDLQFPDPYGSARLWLMGSRIDINFSKNLFWTTFLQYNTQSDNFNINSRLQWQFAPMSDFFLVYTDNYAVESFGPKNRALVMKMSYWLTL
ncbi:MAG: DUF5916 domain-containing protein [Bacteroidota bacterium]